MSAAFVMDVSSFNIVYRKLILLEELNFTREEKRKTDENLSRTEEKLRLAHDTIHKMKQDLKTLNEKRDMVVEKKGGK